LNGMRQKALVLALLLGHFAAGYACDSGTVRDAAFHVRRDTHRLCVVANKDDASARETFSRLDAWLANAGKDLNAAVVRVNANEADVDWASLGMPSAPPSLPVVALIGEFPSPRRPFVIDHWEPTPTEADLNTLIESPARKAIQEALLKSWAVVAYSSGKNGESDDTKSMFDAVERKWAEEQSPGISVVRFDRADASERILCAFAGIKDDGRDWAGVVFGKGKLLAPPLRGEDVAEANLNSLLENLAAQCTCLQQSNTVGLDIPMVWNDAMTSKVVALPPPQGYSEFVVETKPTQAEKALGELQADIPDEPRSLVTATVAALGAAGAIAAFSVAFAVWRRRGMEGSAR